MSVDQQCLRQRLRAIARESDWFMQALESVRSLQLDSWCIGAGAVRNLVWDHLHGYATPSPIADVDVAYFDDADLRPETEQALQALLCARHPGTPWEVTNQAWVHLWFEGRFGHRVAPLRSLEDAVASWPEFATSVGIKLQEDSEIEVIAPHGLEDLFSMVVRRNPARVSVETYRNRVAEKRYLQRWPRVQIVG
ncbi:nucleotidyltransferase family protein [Pseudoduganella namucuonensis]|uniref:Nucleotidyltransferase family protein n=1 Tax=Pseudoduganella namucuonensis TaxID=1035707 RepID=A0A1I7EUI4_9BURK|nr:nucleotidyltransferase family protein [Pseudoduganella namucuonensis]SFU27562.1 hypothetical protein SAMN05216552_1001111 [Pseudoduganella namucuonensis]